MELGAPWSDLRRRTEADLRTEWNRDYERSGGLRQTKAFLPNVNSKIAGRARLLSRADASRLVRFVTGHGTLRGHGARFGEVNDSRCRLCGDQLETPMHLLRECIRLCSEREGLDLGADDESQGELDFGDLLIFIRELESILAAPRGPFWSQ